MNTKNRNLSLEVTFQVILHLVVFVFFGFQRNKGQVEAHIDAPQIMFFLNYVAAALVINYIFLPKFLYKKKVFNFIFAILLMIAVVIFIEEGVIEKIFFPDTRGSRFPGVFNNLLAAMPTITILVGFKFAWDAVKQRRKLEELQLMVKESELQYLKTQINPHFLFNNLNNLYAYALEQSPKTPEIILELSGVLRYMLYECQEETVPLKKEIEQLENFVNLSKLQIENRGNVHFTQSIIGSNYRIAPLILSVFVENAIKHSVSSLNKGISIIIYVSVNSEGVFQFSCSNFYSSSSNIDDLSKGIGLENVRKRLELIYPSKHELQIDTKGEIYSVNLTLELEKRQP